MVKYARLKNMAVVFACLVVRSYFLAESETDLAYAGVMLSRASLCELLAMKLLSHFASHHIQLVAVLTTSWNPLAGASRAVVEELKQILGAYEDDLDSPQSALEVRPSFSSHINPYVRSRWPYLPKQKHFCHPQLLKKS